MNVAKQQTKFTAISVQGLKSKKTHQQTKNALVIMTPKLLALMMVMVVLVQVPQWQETWTQCSIDAPDVDCHWYVTSEQLDADIVFDWQAEAWYETEKLISIGKLKTPISVLKKGQT